MSRVLIIVGSVRPGRIGLPIAEWVRDTAEEAGLEVDFADLAEVALPFLDEPAHPSQQQYTKEHTVAWSARVQAADSVILVSPEYNHSYAPALKNALDFLFVEWRRKLVATVSYGGISAGTRGVAALAPVLAILGTVRALHTVELSFAGKRVADGAFAPSEREQQQLEALLAELAGWTPLA